MAGDIRTIAQQRAEHTADMLALMDAAVAYGERLGRADDPTGAMQEGEALVRALRVARDRFTHGSFAFSSIDAAHDYWHAVVYRHELPPREGAE